MSIQDGHARGSYSHGNGYKIDIRKDYCVDMYIKRMFSYSGKRGDGAGMYRARSGNVYADEGNHWDIKFTASC